MTFRVCLEDCSEPEEHSQRTKRACNVRASAQPPPKRRMNCYVFTESTSATSLDSRNCFDVVCRWQIYAFPYTFLLIQRTGVLRESDWERNGRTGRGRRCTGFGAWSVSTLWSKSPTCCTITVQICITNELVLRALRTHVGRPSLLIFFLLWNVPDN